MIKVQTVFLIDNNSILHDALRHVLPSNKFAVKWFNCLDKFIAEYQQKTGGCLLIDNSKFIADVISMQTSLNTAQISIPAVYLADQISIPSIIKAIQLNAANVIIKPFNNALLLESLYLALETDKAKQHEYLIEHTIHNHYASLSKREKQVMQLIINGASNKQMAHELQITLKTIEAHRAKVMRKMQADSLAYLVKISIKYNLIKTTLIRETN